LKKSLFELAQGIISTSVQSTSNPGLLVQEAISVFMKDLVGEVDETAHVACESQAEVLQGAGQPYSKMSFNLETLSSQERREVLDNIRSELAGGRFLRSGPERASQWSEGWGENLKLLLDSEVKDFSSLVPKYFGKYPFVRLEGRHLKVPLHEGMESSLLSFLVDSLIHFSRKNLEITQVWEFGCGTGHHLLRIRRNHPDLKLVGLDWAESSQQLISAIATETNDRELIGINFDLFNPREDLDPGDAAVFLTVASLEQIGDQHEQFLSFVLSKGPDLVIHVEPIAELLGSSDEEQLSIQYFRARNYLSGYLSALQRLESQGCIEILAAERTGLGSHFIEGYSVVVWRIKTVEGFLGEYRSA